MSENPNDVGYTGAVGFEKAVHKTHFTMPEVSLRDHLDLETDPAWVKVGHKWVRVVKPLEGVPKGTGGIE